MNVNIHTEGKGSAEPRATSPPIARPVEHGAGDEAEPARAS